MRRTVEPEAPLAGKVARRLAEVPGVVGVMLGGSHARGTADDESDIDLGVFYDPAQRPPISGLRDVAEALGAEGVESVTDYGEWGPWIEGGAWLAINGRRVDWLYRNIERVGGVVDDCRAGRTVSAYQPGHPHGFHSHIHFGEVALGRILEDRSGALAELKGRTRPYPAALRERLVRSFGWQARFALQIAGKPARRGDAAYVAGCLFVAAGCLVQVLFALNERPFVNEKGALVEAASLPIGPADLRSRVEAALALPGGGGSLDEPVAAMATVVAETQALAADRGLWFGDS